jgi:hypothetical protein
MECSCRDQRVSLPLSGQTKPFDERGMRALQ